MTEHPPGSPEAFRAYLESRTPEHVAAVERFASQMQDEDRRRKISYRLLDERDDERAEPLLRSLLDPDDPGEPEELLGLLLERSGRRDEALPYLRAASEAGCVQARKALDRIEDEEDDR